MREAPRYEIDGARALLLSCATSPADAGDGRDNPPGPARPAARHAGTPGCKGRDLGVIALAVAVLGFVTLRLVRRDG